MNLPNEIIHHIFSYITNVKDIMMMRLVNKNFYDIIMLATRIEKIEISKDSNKFVRLFPNIKSIELYISLQYILRYTNYMILVREIYDDWFHLGLNELSILCGSHPSFIRQLSNLFHFDYDSSLHLILFSTPSIIYNFFYIEMKDGMMIIDKDGGEIYDLRISNNVKVLVTDYISYKINVPITYMYLTYADTDQKIKSSGTVFISTRNPEQIDMDDIFWSRKNRLDTFYDKVPYLKKVEERIHKYSHI